jgi:hypothetical protein
VARKKVEIIDKYIPPPSDLYIYIRKKGWLQPIPYVYKKPDLNFIKNYKKK